MMAVVHDLAEAQGTIDNLTRPPGRVIPLNPLHKYTCFPPPPQWATLLLKRASRRQKSVGSKLYAYTLCFPVVPLMMSGGTLGGYAKFCARDAA
jgi:hypothetical protein